MPRLEPITTVDQVPEGGRDDYETVMASRGRLNAPQSMLFYSPGVGSRAMVLNDHLRASLSQYDYELAVLVASREFPIEFVWSAHVATARSVGISGDLIEAIRSGGAAPSEASPRDRVVIQLGQELVGGRQLSQAAFDAAREVLGEKALIETLMTMGYYLMIGCVLIATDMEPRPDAPPLPNLPSI